MLRGYKIRYQAVGSSVVQYTRLLDRSLSQYEITHLHENTNYEICVLRLETTTRRVQSPLEAAAMHSTEKRQVQAAGEFVFTLLQLLHGHRKKWNQ